MQNWLNYHHLLYFKVIAESGSLAKASEILRVGQSALSMQLKLLEDRLEQPLFERKQKNWSSPKPVASHWITLMRYSLWVTRCWIRCLMGKQRLSLAFKLV